MLGIRHDDWPSQALQHHATTPMHPIGPNPGTTVQPLGQLDDSSYRSAALLHSPNSSTTNNILAGGSPTHLSWQCLLEHAPPLPKKASVSIRYRKCRLG
ncbi:hypothetical protein ASPBRDRAFT_59217 [Aspergillus brasiliensis CBS 101740]|uniref:Uncharacterized protein n=1 Tax=Aspergillus brasiliensis (strain CBS 101740 / IMI 381727 / IBT 21946) TaxID=767769 RepID=A0A1L9U6C3_ASPBC|nr:hypothetical protein ASPBRDRAFT_59217 [Aspergillus brasiliensis CBS 101740]